MAESNEDRISPPNQEMKNVCPKLEQKHMKKPNAMRRQCSRMKAGRSMGAPSTRNQCQRKDEYWPVLQTNRSIDHIAKHALIKQHG